MALTVELEVVNGSDATIPLPQKPSQTGDTDVAEYVPEGMSEEDREALRTAGREWVGTLGGFLARFHPTKAAAAENISHFMNGNGSDKVFGAGDTDDLLVSLVPTGAAVAKTLPELFVDLIYQYIKNSSDTIRRYLARNAGSSVNNGMNWFGVTAESGTKWFYAVGSFLMSCGAYSVKRRGEVVVFYRIYIYDRYNWDVEDGVEKETAAPKFPLSWFLDDDVMNEIGDIKLKNEKQFYFRTGTGYDGESEAYIVNDALMGAQVESGDASNFDITGAGSVHWVRFSSPPGAGTSAQIKRSAGVVR
ncbi:hypothetical protein [Rhodovulum sulfidophilum]|uniref:hypothetical protein n=1 Tax=Rhodovulum sulfidophilum TaxID=35806 RepID=UPI0019230C67|nr:hypothetical protein [Rhodovulum sulfidophilum]MBL3562791.1 hypothetical protein [Rhodovulum sulfidophilum]